MRKAVPKNKTCKDCFWENSDRMLDPCVHCSRAFKRKDMYWSGKETYYVDSEERYNHESNDT